MKVSRPIYILLTAMLITLPLFYFSLKPKLFVRVLINSEKNDNITILTTDQLTEADGEGKAFGHFKAIVSDMSINLVYLKIRPVAEEKYYIQGDGYWVDNGLVINTFQLGSKEYPIRKNESYYYKIEDQSGRTLSHGQISSEARQTVGVESELLAFLGILALVLQILSVFLGKDRQAIPRTE